MIRKLYPGGKQKAFNVTFDDGVLQDVRFVNLLNKYNLKGTFNLNFGLMESEYEWTHKNTSVIKRLSKDKAVSLYQGHEVASHTLTHPYMDNLSEAEILYELQTDKDKLEKLFGRTIKGFAVPFHYYSGLIENCVRKCGFTYARISEESRSFTPQKDFYKWKAVLFHPHGVFDDIVQRFIKTDEELALLQIGGHSYDLDVENMWDIFESLFIKISSRVDILPMTTIEIIEYLQAMNKAEITENRVKNNSNISLWFFINGSACEVKPKETIILRER